MRVEFHQKIQDLTDQEKDYQERMAIDPKDKRYKWRKVLLWLPNINSVYEANEKETIIDYGGEMITVRGHYDDVVEKITELEAAAPPEN
jgi:hypothetical protein